MYHYNSTTSVVSQCRHPQTCVIPEELHAESKPSVDVLKQASLEQSLKETEEITDTDFVKILKKCVQHGFSKYCRHTKDLILTTTGAKYVSQQHALNPSRLTAKILQHIAVYGHIKTIKKFNPNFKPDLTYVSKQEVHDYSLTLWYWRDTPYHNLAKELLKQDYRFAKNTSKTFFKIDEHNTRSVAQELNINACDLPEKTLAYDIETCTRKGNGLRPDKSFITDISIATREHTWVLTGNEENILKEFANIFESHPNHMKIGWSNWLFDDIFLQSRAEFLNLREWNMNLTEVSENHSSFSPVGVSHNPQALTHNHKQTIDLFQTLSKETMMKAQGLKDFVAGLGCAPIIVDRQALHMLSPEERKLYVMSDAVSTLRAFKEF